MQKGQLIKSTTYRYNDNIEAFVDNSINDYEYLEDGSLKTKIESARQPVLRGKQGLNLWKRVQKQNIWNLPALICLKRQKIIFIQQEQTAEEGTWRLSNYSYSLIK